MHLITFFSNIFRHDACHFKLSNVFFCNIQNTMSKSVCSHHNVQQYVMSNELYHVQKILYDQIQMNRRQQKCIYFLCHLHVYVIANSSKVFEDRIIVNMVLVAVDNVVDTFFISDSDFARFLLYWLSKIQLTTHCFCGVLFFL